MIKKVLKWLVIFLLIIIIGFTMYVAANQNKTYDAPYPQITISNDSAVIARGEYLVYGPAHCADCHGDQSQLDVINAGGKVPLSGGYTFKIPPGKFHVPNITPDVETGIGNIPDSVLARSLRYGVRGDGTVIFDFMPFHNTSDADMSAIFSYLRTMEPVKHSVPAHELNLVGKIVKATMIKPVGPLGDVLKSVSPDTSVEYGKYLAHSVANCAGCHTQRDLMTGAFIGDYFAGGLQLESIIDPEHYACIAPNLTPDPETGLIGMWSEETFLARFKTGKVIPHSAMPWGPFKRMSDNDLKAIYRYLKTVKPVKNKTETRLVKLDK